ncbi:MAG: LLM class flavin-dependent oxidoreductase [Chloroflexi bacterium]|nr:LLM class flavin-dependent oxidoreductase [Chloroflexota bacterium]
MEISLGLAPRPEAVAHAARAEQLGFERVWLFDSPALFADVWMTLALVAARTRRVGIGPAVLGPHLRHPVAQASAIVTLEAMAPGRVAAAYGTGLTSRLALGQRPLRWSEVARRLTQVRALLCGETVEVDGAATRLMHLPGYAPPRPVRVPLLLAADGPRGRGVASELADGIVCTRPRPGFRRCAVLAVGTVLGEGEPPDSERALLPARIWSALRYHAAFERDPPSVDDLPGGAAWRRDLENRPAGERHLDLHVGHLAALNERDARHVQPLRSRSVLTGTAAQLRARLSALEEAGATELIWVPLGEAIERELEMFAAATQLSVRAP